MSPCPDELKARHADLALPPGVPELHERQEEPDEAETPPTSTMNFHAFMSVLFPFVLVVPEVPHDHGNLGAEGRYPPPRSP